jgi:hypothetical protein
MSWWMLVDGSWLGDDPADTVHAALRQAIEESGRGPVQVADLLASTAAALSLAAAVPPVRVELQPHGPSSAGGTAVPELVHALTAAFREAVQLYERQLERGPTSAELAATVVFCARPQSSGIARNGDPILGSVAVLT